MRVVARVVALLCFAKVRASFREFLHELEREVMSEECGGGCWR